MKDRMRDRAEEAGEFKRYPVVSWDVGTEIAGKVHGARHVMSKGEDTLVLEIEPEDESDWDSVVHNLTGDLDKYDLEEGIVTVFCGATRLKTHFEAYGEPNRGDYIFIECYGEDEEYGRGGNYMKLFKVAMLRQEELAEHDDVPF